MMPFDNFSCTNAPYLVTDRMLALLSLDILKTYLSVHVFLFPQTHHVIDAGFVVMQAIHFCLFDLAAY